MNLGNYKRKYYCRVSLRFQPAFFNTCVTSKHYSDFLAISKTHESLKYSRAKHILFNQVCNHHWFPSVSPALLRKHNEASSRSECSRDGSDPVVCLPRQRPAEIDHEATAGVERPRCFNEPRGFEIRILI